MAVSSITAGRYACKMSGWTITNLKLQKILYIAHMVYVGRTDGTVLIDEMFEAWDFGPVLPNLYHRVKILVTARSGTFSPMRSIPKERRRAIFYLRLAASLRINRRASSSQ